MSPEAAVSDSPTATTKQDQVQDRDADDVVRSHERSEKGRAS